MAAGNAAAPELSLTAQDLRAMTAALPKTVQDRINGESRAFLHLLSQVLDEPSELLLLVDKKHALTAGDVPPDLVSLSSYPFSVGRADLFLRKAVIPDLLQMVSAARADRVTLLFSSSYRSYEYQEAVYEREVNAYGRQAADRESARPGTYITRTAAKLQKEYFDDIQQYLLEFLHDNGARTSYN